MRTLPKTALWVFLMGVATILGCGTDDKGYSTSEGCPGEVVEYEQTSFCVLIEEGFLASDCPDAFPDGEEVEGVVVCAEEGQEIPEGIKEELEERDIIPDDDENNVDMSCEDDADCPDEEDYRACVGSVAQSSSGAQGVCVEGVCQQLATPGALFEEDCAALGLSCRAGDCVDDSAQCTEDSECPSAPSIDSCEGNIATRSGPAAGVCNEEGMCDLLQAPGFVEDCGEQGLICSEGFCVEGSCSMDSDCPVPGPIPPYCEGNEVVIPVEMTSVCADGQCTLVGEPVLPERINCAEDGQICVDGACRMPEAECLSDEECPQPIPFIGCEEGIAVQIFASGYCSEDGVCMIDGEESRIDCTAQGEACLEGECVAILCDEDTVCPDGPDYMGCEGDIAQFSNGPVGVCLEGVCEQLPTPGALLEIDCTEMGQVCVEGACVNPDGDMCRDDRQCDFAFPPEPPSCDGDLLYIPEACNGECVDGTCQEDCSTSEILEVDCSAEGQVCRDGACVGDECTEDSQCPDGEEYRACDGNTAQSSNGPVGVCLEGSCEQLDTPGALLEVDCTETDQVCDEGFCVDPQP